MIGWLVSRLAAAFLVASVAAAAGAGQQQPAPGLVVPSDETLAIMIKSVLITFNDANITGNYSVLRDLGSPDFRDSNSAASLAEIFQDMRKNRINIAPIVLYQPKLIRKPEIDAQGDLVLEGFFETRPEQVNFLVVYRAVEGLWRLFAIRVTTKAVPAAPAGAKATESTSKKSKPAGATPGR
jgi:hypothetical protein